MRLAVDWLLAEGPQAVAAALIRAGHQAWFVGGCVRNAVIGAGTTDIDIATDAPPDRMTSIFEASGLRVVPTGLEHGTVTVIAAGQAHEVTTFRRDVTTDGRRATVSFSSTMEEDARRRDFTMNALYADPDGQVADPLGGLPDLLAGHVRFIGDPKARITEDFLRILRFFRFHAWFGNQQDGIDAEGLAACAELADGLSILSKERVTAELVKLLSARDPGPATAAMGACGVLARVLPGADAMQIPPLVHIEQSIGLDPDPLRRLCALGLDPEAMDLRLSRAETRRLTALRAALSGNQSVPEIAYRHGFDLARDIIALRAAAMGQEVEPGALNLAKRAAREVFPVRAADLMPKLSGPAIGQRLTELESRWIASGFTLDRAALLGASTD